MFSHVLDKVIKSDFLAAEDIAFLQQTNRSIRDFLIDMLCKKYRFNWSEVMQLFSYHLEAEGGRLPHKFITEEGRALIVREYLILLRTRQFLDKNKFLSAEERKKRVFSYLQYLYYFLFKAIETPTPWIRFTGLPEEQKEYIEGLDAHAEDTWRDAILQINEHHPETKSENTLFKSGFAVLTFFQEKYQYMINEPSILSSKIWNAFAIKELTKRSSEYFTRRVVLEMQSWLKAGVKPETALFMLWNPSAHPLHAAFQPTHQIQTLAGFGDSILVLNCEEDDNLFLTFKDSLDQFNYNLEFNLSTPSQQELLVDSLSPEWKEYLQGNKNIQINLQYDRECKVGGQYIETWLTPLSFNNEKIMFIMLSFSLHFNLALYDYFQQEKDIITMIRVSRSVKSIKKEDVRSIAYLGNHPDLLNALQNRVLKQFIFEKMVDHARLLLEFMGNTNQDYFGFECKESNEDNYNFKTKLNITPNASGLHQWQAKLLRYLIRKSFGIAVEEGETIWQIPKKYAFKIMQQFLNKLVERFIGMLIVAKQNEEYLLRNNCFHPVTGKGSVEESWNDRDFRFFAPSSSPNCEQSLKVEPYFEFKIEARWQYDNIVIQMILNNALSGLERQNSCHLLSVAIHYIPIVLGKAFYIPNSHNNQFTFNTIFIDCPLAALVESLKNSPSYAPYQAIVIHDDFSIDEKICGGQVYLAMRAAGKYNLGFCTPGGYNTNAPSFTDRVTDLEFGKVKSVLLAKSQLLNLGKDKNGLVIYSALPKSVLIDEMKADSEEFRVNSLHPFNLFELGRMPNRWHKIFFARTVEEEKEFEGVFNNAMPLRPVDSLFYYMNFYQEEMTKDLNDYFLTNQWKVQINQDHQIVIFQGIKYYKPVEFFGEITVYHPKLSMVWHLSKLLLDCHPTINFLIEDDRLIMTNLNPRPLKKLLPGKKVYNYIQWLEKSFLILEESLNQVGLRELPSLTRLKFKIVNQHGHPVELKQSADFYDQGSAFFIRAGIVLTGNDSTISNDIMQLRIRLPQLEKYYKPFFSEEKEDKNEEKNIIWIWQFSFDHNAYFQKPRPIIFPIGILIIYFLGKLLSAEQESLMDKMSSISNSHDLFLKNYNILKLELEKSKLRHISSLIRFFPQLSIVCGILMSPSNHAERALLSDILKCILEIDEGVILRKLPGEKSSTSENPNFNKQKLILEALFARKTNCYDALFSMLGYTDCLRPLNEDKYERYLAHYIAMYADNVSFLKNLFHTKGLAFVRDRLGFTPLMYYVFCHRTSQFYIKTYDVKQLAPHSFFSDEKSTAVLLRHPNNMDANGNTLLHMAMQQHESFEFVAYLLKGYDVSQDPYSQEVINSFFLPNKKNVTPLELGLINWDDELLIYLVDYDLISFIENKFRLRLLLLETAIIHHKIKFLAKFLADYYQWATDYSLQEDLKLVSTTHSNEEKNVGHEKWGDALNLLRLTISSGNITIARLMLPILADLKLDKQEYLDLLMRTISQVEPLLVSLWIGYIPLDYLDSCKELLKQTVDNFSPHDVFKKYSDIQTARQEKQESYRITLDEKDMLKPYGKPSKKNVRYNLFSQSAANAFQENYFQLKELLKQYSVFLDVVDKETLEIMKSNYPEQNLGYAYLLHVCQGRNCPSQMLSLSKEELVAQSKSLFCQSRFSLNEGQKRELLDLHHAIKQINKSSVEVEKDEYIYLANLVLQKLNKPRIISYGCLR